MDQNTLHELGEWAALGFYEGLELPYPRAYGLAFRRLYENMPVRVPDERLLIPCEPFFEARNMDSHGEWTGSSFICNFNHHSGLDIRPAIAEEKQKRFPQHAGFIDALVTDLRGRLPHFGGYTHSNPDIRRVVSEGFDAMEAELDRELALAQSRRPMAVERGISVSRGSPRRIAENPASKGRTVLPRGVEVPCQAQGDDEQALNLLLALKDYTTGVRCTYQRSVEALRAARDAATGSRHDELVAVTDAFENCFLTPSRTFLQGLLAVNLTWMLDGCDSIGRVDQALGPLFEQDIEAGTLDLRFARRLIDELWRNFERFNGWNLQIGGRRADGSDGCNALTREFVLACGRNHFRRPNVAFRVTRDTPDNLLIETLKALAAGSGRPALYNDDLYIQTLLGLDLGLTPADATEIGFGGCTETMIAGLSNCGSLEGTINLAKALELALHNGIDPSTGAQAGPATGRFEDMASFDAFLQAVKAQIRDQTTRFAESANAALRRRFTAGDPKLYRTFFTRDCVRNHRSFEAGGARYNWSVVTYQGIANLIDGLAAVNHCVFARGEVAKEALVPALAADFAGFEQVLGPLKAAPKFGNDDSSVDRIGAEIMDFACRELLSHRMVRGGRFLPSCIVFATYADAGVTVGATPDGRQAGTPLNDSVGAVAGRDTHGPTALLNSVTALPMHLAAGTPVLNLRFQKQTLQRGDGLRAVAALIRAFFSRGGMQIQLSVLSREEMLAAQVTPEPYRDLLVRIGGYSEYFTRLSRALQDSVIARTEYVV